MGLSDAKSFFGRRLRGHEGRAGFAVMAGFSQATGRFVPGRRATRYCPCCEAKLPSLLEA